MEKLDSDPMASAPSMLINSKASCRYNKKRGFSDDLYHTRFYSRVVSRHDIAWLGMFHASGSDERALDDDFGSQEK